MGAATRPRGPRGRRARQEGTRAGRGEGPRARFTTRPLPSLTPGSLDWSMLTSAMLGQGRGRPSLLLPGCRRHRRQRARSNSSSRSSSCARRGAKSGRQRARAGRRERAAGQKLATKATGDWPDAPSWRPSCPTAATCSRAPSRDRYQISGAWEWTRAVQYGGREETERPASGRAGGPGWGGGGERQVCNRNCEWLESEDQLPRPPPCRLLCVV